MSKSPGVRSLTLPQYVGYGVGSLGTSAFATVTSLALLFFLTDALGVDPRWAGLVVFVPKLWDVVTDPIMGSISDGVRTRWGRRRPYLLAGALLMGVSLSLLFAVPREFSPAQSAAYVCAMFILCCTAYTLFSVPYTAMPAEMTGDHHEFTTIMSYRMVFLLLGILVAGGLAPEILKAFEDARVGYAVMSVTLGVMCMVAMLVTFLAVANVPQLEASEGAIGFVARIRIAAGNPPFLSLLAPYFLQLAAVNCVVACLPHFAKYVLGLGEAGFGLAFVAMVVPGIVTMPAWVLISRRIGKRRAYGLSVLMFAVVAFSFFWSSATSIGYFYLRMVLAGLAYSGTQLFPFSMLPDIIRYDAIRSGSRREGAFTGLWTAGEKTGVAVGTLMAGLILGMMGFEESTSGRSVTQSEQAILGIRLAFALIPASLLLVSLPLLKIYRLTPDIIRDAENAASNR